MKKHETNVLEFYYLTQDLKEKLRSGWVEWGVKNCRIESVAEHIYGTQMLAIAMKNEYGINIDLAKVIMMLSLHETEEILIGDITPFDGISDEEKSKRGKDAVAKIFKGIANSDSMIALIDEFNAKSSKEARFAYLCDKMDCILQIKKYVMLGCVDKIDVSSNIIDDPRIQKLLADKTKSVFDIFYQYSKEIFEQREFKQFKNLFKRVEKYK